MSWEPRLVSSLGAIEPWSGTAGMRSPPPPVQLPNPNFSSGTQFSLNSADRAQQLLVLQFPSRSAFSKELTQGLIKSGDLINAGRRGNPSDRKGELKVGNRQVGAAAVLGDRLPSAGARLGSQAEPGEGHWG